MSIHVKFVSTDELLLMSTKEVTWSHSKQLLDEVFVVAQHVDNSVIC